MFSVRVANTGLMFDAASTASTMAKRLTADTGQPSERERGKMLSDGGAGKGMGPKTRHYENSKES
jgi:hypothetical protein